MKQDITNFFFWQVVPGQELWVWEKLQRWARDRRNSFTSYCFPQKCTTVSSFPWGIQTNTTSWPRLLINQMHSTIVTETSSSFLLLEISLFFHLNLSRQTSFSEIIVYLYKPNFWPFQIFICLWDDGPHFTLVPDLPQSSSVSWRLFFLAHLCFLLHVKCLVWRFV